MTQQSEPFKTTIRRTVVVGQSISDEQRDKLLYIARNCPVARLLQGDMVLETVLNLA